jgi:hypothetical protein
MKSNMRALMGFLSLGTLCAISSSGCAIWRPGNTGEIRREETKELLVVTRDQRAFEVDVARSDETRIYGTVVRAWLAPPAAATAQLLNEGERSPSSVARALGWRRELAFKGGEPITIKLADIQFVRVYEPRHGRTIAAVFGGLLGLAALGVGIALIAFAASVKCGRPLRVRGRRVVTPIRRDASWNAPLRISPVAPDEARVLAEIWREEAQAEHAAIAAFSKVSLELLALGAPPDLVVRANRAAIQEVEHARLCFAVASAYSGAPIGPAPLPKALEGDTVDLFRVGREALLDGCLREGLAAEVARRGAERARDPEIARVIRLQAKEEAQHAAFGWLIVEWCLDEGGEPMRRMLVASLRDAAFPRCDDLPEHGHLGRSEVEPLFAALIADARARLGADCAARTSTAA